MLKRLERRLRQKQTRERLELEYERLLMDIMRFDLRSVRERRKLNKLIRERKHDRSYIV
jgi:hypothetical protein